MTDHPLVVIDTTVAPRFRAADMRVIKAMTGKSVLEMIREDGDDADRMQALAFYALRRADPDAAAKTLWELADEADVEMADTPPDPTNGSRPATSTASPPFAGIGGAPSPSSTNSTTSTLPPGSG
jgi:hypothetical protein